MREEPFGRQPLGESDSLETRLVVRKILVGRA
jgi:hypothetical protein